MPESQEPGDLTKENIALRNFSGEAGEFENQGQRHIRSHPTERSMRGSKEREKLFQKSIYNRNKKVERVQFWEQP